MTPRRTLPLVLSILTLAAAGCGSEGKEGAASGKDDPRGSNGDNSLALSDAAEVLMAQRAIDAACGSDGSGSPGGNGTAITDAVSTLESITEQYPERVYETGNVDRAETMTTISGQVTEQLKRCGVPAQADRLAKLRE